MATKRPKAVANNTSEMLAESLLGSAAPEEPRVLKAFIIPMTVPVKPTIGLTTPITDK